MKSSALICIWYAFLLCLFYSSCFLCFSFLKYSMFFQECLDFSISSISSTYIELLFILTQSYPTCQAASWKQLESYSYNKDEINQVCRLKYFYIRVFFYFVIKFNCLYWFIISIFLFKTITNWKRFIYCWVYLYYFSLVWKRDLPLLAVKTFLLFLLYNQTEL